MYGVCVCVCVCVRKMKEGYKINGDCDAVIHRLIQCQKKYLITSEIDCSISLNKYRLYNMLINYYNVYTKSCI